MQEYLGQLAVLLLVLPADVRTVRRSPLADLTSQPVSVPLCWLAFLCRCLEQVCFPQEFVTRLVVAEALSFPLRSVLRFVCFLWKAQEFARVRGHLSLEVLRWLRLSVQFPPHLQRGVCSAAWRSSFVQGAAGLFLYFPAAYQLVAAVSLWCSLLPLHSLSIQGSVCGAFAVQVLSLRAQQMMYLALTKTCVPLALRLNFALRAVPYPPAPL
mgnify:CR=1 FL=1